LPKCWATSSKGGWGKGVVAELARYIAQADPSLKGFSDKNLWRMKQFYEAYPGDDKLSPVARVLHPSIGVLLCRDKDDEVVEYALSRNLSPALVAQYQLQLPDKRLIAAKLHELLAMHEGASDE
jgi:hypothetical protein